MLYTIFKCIFWYCIATDRYEFMQPLSKNKIFHAIVVYESELMQIHYKNHLEIDENYLYKIYFGYTQLKTEKSLSAGDVQIWLVDCNDTSNVYSVCLAANRQYQEYCQTQIEMGYPNNLIYNKILDETRYIYKIYDMLDDLNRFGLYLWQKRIRCYRLKTLLGDECYEQRYIPPFVPIWRFIKMD